MTQEDCGSPSNFNGYWAGTYQCGNSCGENEGDSVFISLSQEGSSASYIDDGGYQFDGTVCRNVFSFIYNGDGETESGTMTLMGSDFAIKRSTWAMTVSPFCTGDCLDTLYRLSID